ncbi:hypothetical protein QEG73_15205 [Chitinophagaceae bacterium 26-R-25]|nr:hypothetical protein [Chitinophagaceae bacterium 26-R-25]
MKYFFLSLLFGTLAITTNAQNPKKVDLNEFILECMKNTGDLPHKQMAFWLPSEYWDVVAEQMKLAPDAVAQIQSEMNNYLLFVAVDYSIASAQFTYKSDDEIRKTLKLTDSLGNSYSPLGLNDVSPLAQQFLGVMQPLFAKLCGQLGEGMHIYLFDSKKVNAKTYISLKKPNRLFLSWDDVKIKWTTPFASVLPAKVCPVDHELMKGNWNYCPVHGAKLN